MAETIVVDANIAVRAVLPHDDRDRCLGAFVAWSRARAAPVAPEHWLAEAVSGIRRTRAAREISDSVAERAVADLFALGLTSVAVDIELAAAGLRWADRLGHSRAYDALYLAVAERFDAPLVTADQRLLARCGQLGVDFVAGLPEIGAG